MSEEASPLSEKEIKKKRSDETKGPKITRRGFLGDFLETALILGSGYAAGRLQPRSGDQPQPIDEGELGVFLDSQNKFSIYLFISLPQLRANTHKGRIIFPRYPIVAVTLR